MKTNTQNTHRRISAHFIDATQPKPLHKLGRRPQRLWKPLCVLGALAGLIVSAHAGPPVGLKAHSADSQGQSVGMQKPPRPPALPWEEHVPGAVPDALGGFAMTNIFEDNKPRGLAVVQLVRGDTRRKEVALTFDDGPHPPFTLRLLDLLKQLNVHATFFVVGRKVDAAPEILERMIQEGHEVANHTYHHVNLKTLPPGLVENEIRLDNDAIRRACGRAPLCFRPPGGQRSGEVIEIARKLGMTTVLWTDDPADYANPGAQVIEQKLITHVKSGATILLHDGVEQTYQILPDLIARLRQQGYKFVTVSEMVQRLEASHSGHLPQDKNE